MGYSLEWFFPLGRRKVWRERTGWPHPISTELMQAEWPTAQACASGMCVSRLRSRLWQQGSFWEPFQWLYIGHKKKTQREKIRGNYALSFKVLQNVAFPLGYELFLSLVCSYRLKFDKQVRKLGRTHNSNATFPMETDAPKCYSASVWSLTNRQSWA